MEGWNYQPLGTACNVFSGNSINAKIKQERYILDVGTPYVATKDVGFNHEIDYENGVRIPEEEESSFRVAPPKCVLLCAEGGSAGRKVAHNTRKAHFVNKLYALVPGIDLDSKLLFYYCITKEFYETFSSLKRGLIGGVSSKKLKSIPIPLPPLPEQERIVAILDEAFAAIATATANAEKNLANARELFESQHTQIFIDLEESCPPNTLSDIAGFRNGANFSKASRGKSVKVVGVGDFLDRFWIPTDQLSEKTLDGDLRKEDELHDGDILFVRSNGNKDLIGRCMLMGESNEPITYSGFTIRMRIETSDIYPPYLCWYLKSPQARNRLTESGDGAQINNLNQGSLGALPAPVPEIEKQHAITRQLDQLNQEIDSVISAFSTKTTALTNLKQSLLHKAFTGELTADKNATDRTLSEAGV